MSLNNRNLTNSLLIFVSLVTWWFTANMINPELHYFLQQSAFLTNSLFFEGFTCYPGGIADYISEFISQFFYFKTFGSFLIILISSLQGIIAIKLVQKIAGKVKLNFSIFTLILMLSFLVQCNYFYPFYASIRLLIAFGFVWIFTVIASKFPRWRFYSSFLLAMLLFYLAGGAVLFTFTVSVILIHLRLFTKKADLLFLPLFALFSGVLPYMAYKYIFLVNLSLVYSITHSQTIQILSYIPDFKLFILYSLLPVYVLCAVIFNRFNKKSINIPEIKAETSKSKIWDLPILWLAIQFTLIAVIAILSVKFTYDKTVRNKILVSFYGANGDWVNVIKTAESLKIYDPFINFEYNKALANTGKLTDNLFNYTQLAGSAGLFMDEAVTSDVPFICSDQYYDLGFMHESEHWAFEAQTIFPNSPRIMKRLVQINLVNGKNKLAEKFLGRLNENMLYHDWVAQHQKFINDTSLVNLDTEFAWKRKCEPVDSFTAINYNMKLKKLLEANPENKMALDYLLCSILLDGDLRTFKDLISENKITTKPLPRLLDEALILYYYMTKETPATDEIHYTKDRKDQFITFIKAIKPFGNDWQLASRSLQKDYGTTYWYYIKCLNPKITKAQIKRQKYEN